MNANLKNILMPTLVLFLICLIVTAALAGTNLLTEEKIAQRAAEDQAKTMSALLDAERFEEAELTLDGKSYTYYIGYKQDTAVGYVFLTEGRGYGGAVSVMTSILPSGEIGAVAVTDASSETPGLGQNATKSDFLDQYTGKTDDTLSAVKQGSGTGASQEIDALTGATITSRAVTDAVNQARELFKAQEGGADA